MIIFYDEAGTIVGTIEGRVHGDEHLRMWMGKPTNKRLVCQWIQTENGMEPDHPQKELFYMFEKDPSSIYSYSINNDTLVKKPGF